MKKQYLFCALSLAALFCGTMHGMWDGYMSFGGLDARTTANIKVFDRPLSSAERKAYEAMREEVMEKLIQEHHNENVEPILDTHTNDIKRIIQFVNKQFNRHKDVITEQHKTIHALQAQVAQLEKLVKPTDDHPKTAATTSAGLPHPPHRKTNANQEDQYLFPAHFPAL